MTPKEPTGKMTPRFQLFCDSRTFQDETHFKKVGPNLFEFKKHQIRFYGDYRTTAFLIAHGVTNKKDDKADPVVLGVARKILSQNDEFEASQRREANND